MASRSEELDSGCLPTNVQFCDNCTFACIVLISLVLLFVPLEGLQYNMVVPGFRIRYCTYRIQLYNKRTWRFRIPKSSEMWLLSVLLSCLNLAESASIWLILFTITMQERPSDLKNIKLLNYLNSLIPGSLCRFKRYFGLVSVLKWNWKTSTNLVWNQQTWSGEVGERSFKWWHELPNFQFIWLKSKVQTEGENIYLGLDEQDGCWNIYLFWFTDRQTLRHSQWGSQFLQGSLFRICGDSAHRLLATQLHLLRCTWKLSNRVDQASV